MKPWGGFTLIEIMVVVVIIGLLALLSVPAFQKVRNISRANILANDLRTFSGAFSTYQLEVGYTPESAPIGVLPGGMIEYLRPHDFYERNTVGGFFKWERFDSASGVGFTARERLIPVVELTDKLLDDGNLNTGRLLLYEGTTTGGGGTGQGQGQGQGQGPGQLPDQAADRAHERIEEIFGNRIGSDWVPPGQNQGDVPNTEEINADGEKFLYIIHRFQ
ncbi:MAG: prepilin-type N-terminal cleavage/methylation domain-containing protein [Opitutales bacterium]|nr:prepilin-type N-terminal cleavage/methylation domain-containing protein [Opitutales bacterium]MCH8541537.1 prepilin-type N-terminal cleavage/methylation domain-containing protein [Opitutales bacterium]